MDDIYWLAPTMKFDGQLLYLNGMCMEKEPCPRHPEHSRFQRWIRPLKVVGPVVPHTDIEWTVYSDIIVGPEIAADLKSQRFTGITFDIVDFHTTTGTPFGREGYETRVNGWGGFAPIESGITVKEECSFCGRRVYTGIKDIQNLFDIDGWDGSDFFIIWPMPRRIMVTRRVRDFLESRNYSGIIARPLVDLPTVRVSGTSGFSPGHLQDWFDDNKVAEIMRRR